MEFGDWSGIRRNGNTEEGGNLGDQTEYGDWAKIGRNGNWARVGGGVFAGRRCGKYFLEMENSGLQKSSRVTTCADALLLMVVQPRYKDQAAHCSIL
jgi:hypothetical protein